MNNINLNELEVKTDALNGLPLQDNSIFEVTDTIDIIFRNQRQILLDKIKTRNLVIGCVAWLTDPVILEALSNVPYVSIIVQKEDFLRPDANSPSNWKVELKQCYDKLQNKLERYFWPGIISELSICGDQKIAPIRCVGNHNSEKKPAFPRMHNKFLIFGNVNEEEDRRYEFEFCETVTGSYNITKNASNRFENMVVIRNKSAMEAFYNEFSQIFALSEPLNWHSDWCEPQYRIGT